MEFLTLLTDQQMKSEPYNLSKKYKFNIPMYLTNMTNIRKNDNIQCYQCAACYHASKLELLVEKYLSISKKDKYTHTL